ncbi:Flavodoxin reductases (ferredoxin-NADPH reductases) family 1 [Fulvivirga imtechensis AK7]|uniref:Flavodoxin reductases (Ferredoxin-NADPH reductases) family 1 n=1 Tax=Fulvivirga imtechensis AK7 TaxID=1237149 RepID=L8JLP9_9BACT|nr:MOSC N-terminal beta barrel domain-containing protein [Fulvivirga imtechensis]ELR68302.1 Flavodoxin reductases (ferredoxin-NADPH reductases) family 1 [Fulvivirga imtechensis AK7]
MFLSDIILYPIKSLPGVRINESKVEPRGLQYDRRWMLVDEDNKFITIRQHHDLLLFDLQIEGKGFVVKHRETGDALELPWEISDGVIVKVKIWDDEVEAITGNDNWGAWFEDKLGIACRLVYMGDQAKRPIKQEWSKDGEIVSFADAYPLLVIGSASLADLNQKLEKRITIDRFRPNLVFEGGEPYEEFRWGKFKIGENLFQGLKPCERCIVTTLDPVTAEKGREPLLTLSKQKINNKIVFGQHAYGIHFGTIKVDDNIEVLQYKDSPYDPV